MHGLLKHLLEIQKKWIIYSHYFIVCTSNSYVFLLFTNRTYVCPHAIFSIYRFVMHVVYYIDVYQLYKINIIFQSVSSNSKLH